MEKSAKKKAAKKSSPSARKVSAAKKPAAKKAAAKGVSAKAAAEKNRREREIYKVSPLRGMPIEKWIELKTSGWQAEVVRRVVAVVQHAAPEATCSIKWSQPIFEQNGPFAFIKLAKAHLSVGFWRGSEVVDPKGILERGDRMGHFKLRAASELDEGALKAMVKDAVRLNKEKGSPTVRG